MVMPEIYKLEYPTDAEDNPVKNDGGDRRIIGKSKAERHIFAFLIGCERPETDQYDYANQLASSLVLQFSYLVFA